MDDKADNRDWEREAAEAKICLNCRKKKCTGGDSCFKELKGKKGRRGKKSDFDKFKGNTFPL